MVLSTIIWLSLLSIAGAISLLVELNNTNKNCDAPLVMAEKNGIDGQYIVVLEDNVTDEEAEKIGQTMEIGGAKVRRKYSCKNKGKYKGKKRSGKKFQGFAINVDEKKRIGTLSKVKRNCGVKRIEQDQTAKVTACNTQQNAGWCLSKIPQLNNQYTYPSTAGAGATVYVIDTGCNWTHPDLNGRISLIKNLVSTEGYYDLNGHGTATASLVGGYSSGSSKAAKLVCVKAMNKNGYGAYSDIIAAVNWCSSQDDYGIISISLGGGFSQVMNDAVTNAYNSGNLPIVAAGNEYQDASNVSPASTSVAITVAASDWNNNFASFSNWGKFIDIIAPGVGCNSANAQSNAIGQSTGTSIATSLTAGIAANIQALYGLTNTANAPQQITNILLGAAKQNQVSNVPAGTVNKLLYWNYC